MTVWCVIAAALSELPVSLVVSLPIAVASLLVARWLFPAVPALGAARAEPRYELPVRMVVAVLLTLFTTSIAEGVGTAWTGLIAMFPVLSTLLAVFSHRAQGGAYAVAILRALATGLYALSAFVVVLAVVLPHLGAAYSFLSAIASGALVQWATRPRASALYDNG